MARVLKSGARISALDWVLLPRFDSTDPEHVELVERACGLLGAVGSPTVMDLEIAMQTAGLEIVLSENPSIDQQQNQMISAERVRSPRPTGRYASYGKHCCSRSCESDRCLPGPGGTPSA